MQNATPDILIVQEMYSQVGMNGFLSNVLNHQGDSFSAGTFIDGPDTDRGCFYSKEKFTFISNKPSKTQLRDINEFTLVYKPTGDTLRVFGAHLKASTGSDNVAARAADVDSLRKYTNSLPGNAQYVIVGDFNIYSSNETGYKKLLDSTTGTGFFIDPLKLTGTFNNITYAKYHTQSPRVRSFQGGATGGMDDRFDYILYSKAIREKGQIDYVENSTIAYGNDGQHYNDSINRMPNTAVSQQVATALHYASDHIPVIAKFSVTKDSVVDTNVVSVQYVSGKRELSVYPNPASTHLYISTTFSSSLTITMYDLLGRAVLTNSFTTFASNNTYKLDLPVNIRTGLYTVVVSDDSGLQTYRLVVNK